MMRLMLWGVMGVTMAAAVATAQCTPSTPITWSSAVNVTVTNNGQSNNSMTKPNGTNAVWDAGAASSLSFSSGDVAVQYTVTATSQNEILGLSNSDVDQSYTTVKWGIYAAVNQSVYDVFESGTMRFTTTLTAGDVLKVSVEGGVVKYYRNTTVVYTSTVPASYPLIVDSAIADVNSTINDVLLCGITPPTATPTIPPSATPVPSTPTQLPTWPGGTPPRCGERNP